MRKLTEVDYNKIFGPEVMASLKGKSGEELKKLANQNLRGSMRNLLPAITKAEEGHRPQLEKAAVELVKELYPIIDEYGIKIEAHIVPFGDTRSLKNLKDKWDSLQEADEYEDEESDEEQEMKRRLSNALQQGASLRGTYGFLFFKKHLDDIEGLAPGITDDYKNAMNAIFGSYDDDNGIAYMMSHYQQNPEAQRAGESRAIEKNGELVIQAWGINFPVLVHEIIKGLKSITIGWPGYSSSSKEKNQAVVNKVDKLENEPEDLRWGKFLADALSNIYYESDIDDLRVRDSFETEVAKLRFKELKELLSNAVLNKLTSSQKSWINNTLKELEAQWKKYDSESSIYNQFPDNDEEDILNENNKKFQRMQQLAGVKEIKINTPILKLEDLKEFYNFFKNDQDIFKGSRIDYAILVDQDEILNEIWESYVSWAQEMDEEDEDLNDYPKTKDDLLNPDKQTMNSVDTTYREIGMFLLPYIAEHLKKTGWEYDGGDTYFSKNGENIDIFDYIKPLRSADTSVREGLAMNMEEWLEDNWDNI